MSTQIAQNIVIIVHYFPPINSAGGKRMEAMAKYFARAGRSVAVITTAKKRSDGEFTEKAPVGVSVVEIRASGRSTVSKGDQATPVHSVAAKETLFRKLKVTMMRLLGQLPDPRLPFAFGFLSPFLDAKARSALKEADVVIASCPPWPTLLAAVFVRWRFRRRVIMDYRDHFSECHEMPGSRVAKRIEIWIDRWLSHNAARLVVVSSPMEQYYRRWNKMTDVVLNGYDPEVIDEVRARFSWKSPAAGGVITLRYLGTVTPERIPKGLLSALAELVERGGLSPKSIRLQFFGDCALVERYITLHCKEIGSMFEFLAARPYREALALAVQADYLIFSETSEPKTLSAAGVLTTKLFEYLASGRPIIAEIAATTLAGNLILQAGGRHAVATTKDEFMAIFRSQDFWTPPPTIDEPFVTTLSRASQATQYLGVLDSVVRG